MESMSQTGVLAPCSAMQKSIFPSLSQLKSLCFGFSFQAQSSIHLLLCSKSVYDTNSMWQLSSKIDRSNLSLYSLAPGSFIFLRRTLLLAVHLMEWKNCRTNCCHQLVHLNRAVCETCLIPWVSGHSQQLNKYFQRGKWANGEITWKSPTILCKKPRCS